ncbi:4115_t:CDS:2 [Racocetra persica]|uniref:4115_t:CDS:1 n=1 Tax=Racocetra persica TaxID=160502 RepID=A0ACA9KMG7_9GLOM|nr:4115_t:CDS:2 [Racocetra persica]
MVKVQDYIDQNYPKAQRVRVQKLDLRNLDLEEQEYSQKEQTKEIILSGIEFEQPSELIISDYPNVKEIKTEGYFQNEILNITKVTINNCPRLEEVCIPNFSNQFLSLHHLPSLKKFHCGYGKLTGRLDLTPFANLESVHCFGNQFTEINLPAEKLEELAASGNNFGQRDLSFLGHLVNLKVLQIGNNQLIGSLKHLKNLNKLNFLTICDTDIASGLEYLSDELTIGINCYTTKTPAGKVQAIAKQLAPCYNNVSA